MEKYSYKNIKSAAITLLALFFVFSGTARASQTDIIGPVGSGAFGTTVTVLPNGNIVVTDPSYDLTPNFDVGAVHLYDGSTLALISTITGSTNSDQVGSLGVTVLSNGNYVIRSQFWDNPSPAISNVGAVTFGNSLTGVSGVVSASNSLIGASAGDLVGLSGITVLTNGNYVVRVPNWDNPSPAATQAGAVTWGNGTSGVSGVVSASNSLVGSNANDNIGATNGGASAVTALPNGNYVVRSPDWDNPSPLIANVGAVTWSNGASGIIGTVSSSNSLVGTTANDNVGGGLTALTNSNYIVCSGNWDNPSPLTANVGAATWGNGTIGTIGVVSASNSLIGSSVDDQVGFDITALTNGNYVVTSPSWSNPNPGFISNVGAVTWGNGAIGIIGTVSSSNSLVGVSAGDEVGSNGVIALTNGNYVVRSSSWEHPLIPIFNDFGAVTWGNGAVGTSGAVSPNNSLIGSQDGDFVNSVVPLTNGNYVVMTSNWNNNRGAATFCNGASATSAVVSSSNSLVGSTAGDRVGSRTALALPNGNYVVRSPDWDNPSPLTANVGAATWGNGTIGTIGVVSASNSLIGSSVDDQVGFDITALTNGNYVVISANWDNPSPSISNVGAVTWGNGASGIIGVVSSSNSLVGTTAIDNVGGSGVVALTSGNYVIISADWDDPLSALFNVGAVTFGSGTTGISGVVSLGNSLIGSTAADRVGFDTTALSNGNYVVISANWDNPSTGNSNVGAVTLGNGLNGTTGAITDGNTGGNSVLGTVFPHNNFASAFDPTRNRLFVGRSISNTVSVLFFNTNAVNNGNINDTATFDNGLPNALVNAVIPNGRTVNINQTMNIGLVQVGCTGNLTGGSETSYIIGSVRKDFCAAANQSFVYPIGDTDDYSPLTATNVSGTGHLSVSVTDQTLPGLLANSSVSRFWSLSGAGITTDLTFTYTDGDVNAAENTYKVYRRFGNINTQISPSSVNPATNSITVSGVSGFSDWGVGNLLPPTAASVSVGGRVFIEKNSGISRARVILVDSNGLTRTALTNAFGYYNFTDVEVGETYIFSVKHKRFSFAPQILTVMENMDDLNFIAEP